MAYGLLGDVVFLVDPTRQLSYKRTARLPPTSVASKSAEPVYQPTALASSFVSSDEVM